MADDDHTLDGVAQHHGFICPVDPWPQPGDPVDRNEVEAIRKTTAFQWWKLGQAITAFKRELGAAVREALGMARGTERIAELEAEVARLEAEVRELKAERAVPPQEQAV